MLGKLGKLYLFISICLKFSSLIHEDHLALYSSFSGRTGVGKGSFSTKFF